MNVDGATFHPTGPISEDTLVVIPDEDGTLPDGLTEEGIESIIAQKRSGALTQDSATVDAAAAPEGDVAARATLYPWAATRVRDLRDARCPQVRACRI